MASDFRTAIKRRRSYYSIGSNSPISDEAIQDIVNYAVLYTPSAFNSQSARVVVLLGDEHRKLWDIVRETLGKLVPADNFQPTDAKVSSFASGRGTVLFYEDGGVINDLQTNFPLYADMMPRFSENSSGMLQFAVWTMLEDAGLGASLQHYGNLIEAEVARTWKLNPEWKLIAQMPFGGISAEPGPKEFQPIEERVFVFP
ncbi:MAG: nitroreductase family protein [Planctomycetaceae bacterium]|nr:nitroreductase family protein [Planctomycetaceae bacterium]